MLSEGVIIVISFAYMGVLFAIAYFGDKRADEKRSIINNPYIYSLSIAVYCTAWTFYGSVGRAANTGAGFLPIYLGPTLMAALWWLVLRKIIRIAKTHRITSIADFIGSRYGKSGLLAGLVTVIAVIGILPYISLQLKAVATSFFIINQYPELVMPSQQVDQAFWKDSAFYIAMLLAAFTILFGTRHIDVSEQHEGMVAAIAFESVVKLFAFLAVGYFVTYSVFDGPANLFEQALDVPALAELMQVSAVPGSYANWFSLTILSMLAIFLLPRQFQVTVVENTDERHILKACWLFPLYLLVINIFVLPLAFGGLLLFPDNSVDPDTFVLTIPMALNNEWLTLFVFIGGLSAATGMVIVATIALSTMISNELIMPAILRNHLFGLTKRSDLTGIILAIRRGAIIIILLLGYLYFKLIGESYALVTIGLVSFAAAAQFAPSILFGIFWKGATRKGALAGLIAGFVIWAYTLLLPAFSQSGWLPQSFIEVGLFNISVLNPYALFGLEGLDPITHAVFWSLPANVLLLVVVSLLTQPEPLEQLQARAFVNIYEQGAQKTARTDIWSGNVKISELEELVARFLGKRAARLSFENFAHYRGFDLDNYKVAEPHLHLASHAESVLAGAIGSSSARVMISNLFGGGTISIDDVMEILSETSQVMEYSHKLEKQTKKLQATSRELRAANERLTELDHLKDEFVSTVSHELRTPLTSIRAFSEILLNTPDLDQQEREKFLRIIVKESERLTRLINDVLDMAKVESGRMDWNIELTEADTIVTDAVNAVYQLYQERKIKLEKQIPAESISLEVDKDRILQVLINILSNSAKFCESETGKVKVGIKLRPDLLEFYVDDNGPGIDHENQALIFEKFHQVSDQQSGKPKGSGLGLAISKLIIEHHNGRIWVESEPGNGCSFRFTLPRQK